MILAIGIDPTVTNFMSKNDVVQSLDMEKDFYLEDLLNKNHTTVVFNIEDFGISVVKALRLDNPALIIIGCSDNTSESFSNLRTEFLDNGGDDLLVAPINYRELLASHKACLRRIENYIPEINVELMYKNNMITIGHKAREFTSGGNKVEMSRLEGILITTMLSTKSYRSKGYLFDYLLSEGSQSEDMKLVDVLICKIRAKLNSLVAGLGINFIQTIHGQGYKANRDLILQSYDGKKAKQD